MQNLTLGLPRPSERCRCCRVRDQKHPGANTRGHLRATWRDERGKMSWGSNETLIKRVRGAGAGRAAAFLPGRLQTQHWGLLLQTKGREPPPSPENAFSRPAPAQPSIRWARTAPRCSPPGRAAVGIAPLGPKPPDNTCQSPRCSRLSERPPRPPPGTDAVLAARPQRARHSFVPGTTGTRADGRDVTQQVWFPPFTKEFAQSPFDTGSHFN